MAANEDIPVESAPPALKLEDVLKVVVNPEESEVFQSHSTNDDTNTNDDEEETDWREILPPPPPPPLPDDSDEQYEVIHTKFTPTETPTTVGTTTGGGDTTIVHHIARTQKVVPDFAQYKTNVARRLWEAQETAENSGQKSSPDLIPLKREFQQHRKKMRTLIRYLDEYQEAMQVLKTKRTQLFDHYALMSKDTPLWDHVGKPLTPEQVAKIQSRGDDDTCENIELQSQSIMKVADEIGSGSLVAFQQLAAMQDKLDELDFRTRIIDYIDEWDDVVTTMGEMEIKDCSELSKRRIHYVNKVDRLRKRVNRIEQKGVREASKQLQQKLERNENKLEKADSLFEDKSNDLAVVLTESVRRGWIDLYPLIRNAMKFEVNRLSRESSTYGRLTGTLTALKSDYKNCIKDTNTPPEV